MVFEASAPGRAGIIGNPSDIYGGVVVSCSVPARARCRLTLGEEESLPEDLRLWNAAIARFPLPSAARVEWKTEIPRSSGLSGSTALLAATLACVLQARGQSDLLEDRIEYAELVRDIERYDAQVMCGFQDAYMITHGGLNCMDFAGKRPDRPGPFGQISPIRAELPFLLITTGVERLSGAVHGPLAERWLRGEKRVVEAMEKITALGSFGAGALECEDWDDLALAMTENHALTASVGGSGEPIDLLIERCLANGAMAAKLAGAGLGGTVIALAEDPEDLQARLTSEGYSRFMQPAIVEGVRLESSKESQM